MDDVITTAKGFQGRSRRIANIIKAVLSALVSARGRDWLESVALGVSVIVVTSWLWAEPSIM